MLVVYAHVHAALLVQLMPEIHRALFLLRMVRITVVIGQQYAVGILSFGPVTDDVVVCAFERSVFACAA